MVNQNRCFQILYLQVLKAFWRHEPFWEHACYRIMFFLGEFSEKKSSDSEKDWWERGENEL